jgi:hypothetical protein
MREIYLGPEKRHLHQSAPPHLARMIRTCLRSWITAETITGMPGRAAAWRSRARKEMAQISRPGICLPAPFLPWSCDACHVDHIALSV